VGYAVLAAFVVLSWQALTIRYNYGGNWMALFYTGSYASTPAALNFENIYTVRDSEGYDGQFYHYVAHDPFLRTSIEQSVDNPRLRWRRILVPGLAFLLAGGQPAYVDAAFFSVTLAFAALGVYWTARFCLHYGGNPACGFGFLLVPGVLTSIDRMTIDIALAALCAGYGFYAAQDQFRKILPILTLAPLARETGFCLVFGAVVYYLQRKNRSRSVVSAAMAVPGLAWIVFVNRKTPADLTAWLSPIPLAGLARRTLEPLQFALSSRWLMLAAALDYIAVLGMWLAIVLTLWMLLGKTSGPLLPAVAGMALPVLFAGKADIWGGAYEFGRTMSPMLLLLGMHEMSTGCWRGLVPLCMVTPRILLQFEPQAKGIFRGLIHGS